MTATMLRTDSQRSQTRMKGFNLDRSIASQKYDLFKAFKNPLYLQKLPDPWFSKFRLYQKHLGSECKVSNGVQK